MTNDSFAVTDISSASEWEKFGFANTAQLSQLVKFRNEPNELQDAQYLSLMMGQGVIKYEDKGNVGNKKPEDLTRCKKVHAGDMVVNSMNFKIGSFGISPYDGVVSTVYHVMSPVEHLLNTAYLNYWFGVGEFRSQAQNMGNGILEHRRAIKEDRFGAIRIPLPPLETQRRIADYLDKETAQIDTLVAELDGYVELLEKRKKELVKSKFPVPLSTDPLSEFSNSWTKMPIWQIFKRSKVLGFTDLPMVSVFREKGIVYKDEHENLNRTAQDKSIYQLVDTGWLVINRMKAWQGSVGVSKIRGITSGHYICFEPIDVDSLNVDFLNFQVRSPQFKDWFAQYSRGVRPGQFEIDNDWLNSLTFYLPSQEEQAMIVAEIETETAQTDTLIKECRELKEILLKRRQVLITDVVTGKVEV